MKSYFAPGRTELAGNHTDHQKGRVLASAVDKGIHAFAEPNFDNIVRIKSLGFPDMEINLLDLDVHPEEFGSSAALVRGAAAAMYASARASAALTRRLKASCPRAAA